MAANWASGTDPQLSSTYANVINSIRERDDDVAKQFNTPSSNALLGSGHVTGTIRWDGSANKWSLYGGSSWADLSATYAINVSTVVSCAPNNASGANNLPRNNGTLQSNLISQYLGASSQDAAFFRDASNINAGTIADARLPASISSDITGNSASFTVAANNTNNETVYPVFVDGATGTQGAETDTGLTYNPSTGVITTTSVTGNLTGNVTGNTSGSSGSCTGLSATATSLATARTVGMTGDVVWTSAVFNGTGNVTGTAAIQANTVGNSELVNNTAIQVGGLGVGTAGASGEVRATGTVTAHYSDERLKIKTGTINNALDKVNSLTGFNYIENSLANSLGYTTGDNFVGVSAQELQKVLPEAVKPAPFDLGENNKSISGENYLTVQYEKVVPLLIESIKELKSIVDLQSIEIKDLKDQQKFTS